MTRRRDDGPIDLGGPEFDRACRESIDNDIAMTKVFPDLMKLIGALGGPQQTPKEQFETNAKMAKTRKGLEQIRRRIGG